MTDDLELSDHVYADNTANGPVESKEKKIMSEQLKAIALLREIEEKLEEAKFPIIIQLTEINADTNNISNKLERAGYRILQLYQQKFRIGDTILCMPCMIIFNNESNQTIFNDIDAVSDISTGLCTQNSYNCTKNIFQFYENNEGIIPLSRPKIDKIDIDNANNLIEIICNKLIDNELPIEIFGRCDSRYSYNEVPYSSEIVLIVEMKLLKAGYKVKIQPDTDCTNLVIY